MKRIILNDGIENIFSDDSFTFTPLESLDQITINYTDLKSIKNRRNRNHCSCY